MYVNNFVFKTQNTSQYRSQKKVSPSFKGDITVPVQTIQLSDSEYKQMSAILNCYRQLNMMFKAAGVYVTDLFNSGIQGLSLERPDGYVLKDALNSDDACNVDFGPYCNDKNLFTFTISNREGTPVAKMLASKSGLVEVLADEDMDQIQLNKYISEIGKNHDKFFNVVHDKSENMLNSVGEIISSRDNSKVDLSSREDVQKMVEKFLDEKRRFQLLIKLVNIDIFWRDFNFDDKENKSLVYGDLKDKNISYMYTPIENRFFEGLGITIYDKVNKTKQAYVAKTDGQIYKTQVYPEDEYRTNLVWRVHKLKPVSEEELNDSNLRYMFNHASEKTDEAYRFMLKLLYDQNRRMIGSYDSVCEAKQEKFDKIEQSKLNRINAFNEKLDCANKSKLKKTNELSKTPLQGYKAKIAKNYVLSVGEMKIIKSLASYNDRLSAAYNQRELSTRNEVTDRSGLIRRTGKPGVIVKDLLSKYGLYLGISKNPSPNDMSEELSIKVFDKDLDEIARINIDDMGRAKMLVKNDADPELPDMIEEILQKEMKRGLKGKLLHKLDNACYYHENKIAVDSYIRKSYHPITVEKAIEELKAPRDYYKFNDYKIRKLKKNLNAIKEVYHDHERAAYCWQKLYFPEFKKITQGRLDEQNINYEFVIVDNSECNGVRIITKDEKGDFVNGYVIDNEGNVYKMLLMPKGHNPKQLYVERKNFTQLDDVAVKAEFVDLIFNKICNDISCYTDFVSECSNELEARNGRLPHKIVESKVLKYKALQENNMLQAKQFSRELRKIYANILNKEGEVLPLSEINLKHLAKHLDSLFEKPYEERSPHLIHERMPNGRIFGGKIAVYAPDGAKITVLKHRSNEFLDFIYYSIRVQKGKESMCINIHPDNYKIMMTDENNSIVRDRAGNKLTVDKDSFIRKNPLCENMPMYLTEIFDERPDVERQVVDYKPTKSKKAELEARKVREFQEAMRHSLSLNLEDEENLI